MAFGKNPRAQAAGANFRRASGVAVQNSNKRPPKGTVPYFVDSFKPSTISLEQVRVLEGAYLQYDIVGEGASVQAEPVTRSFIQFTDHFFKRANTSIICSAGPLANFKDKRQPCYGCDIFWETVGRNAAGKLESPVISRQNKYAIPIFDYGLYHKMEQYDKTTGNIRIDPLTKEPYFNWTKCAGAPCDACRAGKESKYGHSTHLPLNYGQFQTLRSSALDIEQSCCTCLSEGGTISSEAWVCHECGEDIVDMSTTTLTREELLKFTDNPFQCQCAYLGYLDEMYDCRVCSSRKQSGERASLFDVDLKMKFVESNDKGKILQIAGWSKPHPIAPEFAEAAQPLDLVARYTPLTFDQQVAKFGGNVLSKNEGPRRAPQTATPSSAFVNPYGPRLPQDKDIPC